MNAMNETFLHTPKNGFFSKQYDINTKKKKRKKNTIKTVGAASTVER